MLCLPGCETEQEEPTEERILGGSFAQTDVYRAVFSIHAGNVGSYFGGSDCTGTLIAPYAILTAAHCVTAYDDNIGALLVRTPETLRVQNSNAAWSLWSPQGIGVEEVIVHPGYVRALRYNDLAVLRLSEDGTSASQGMMVRPIEDLDEDHVGVARGIDLVGFGLNNIEPPVVGPALPDSGYRQHAVLELDALGCSVGLHCAFDNVKLSWTNDEDGGACFGDSGGPVLVFHDAAGAAAGAATQWGTPTPPGGQTLLGGVITGGPSDCNGEGFGTRVDTSSVFLSQFLADLDGSGDVDMNDWSVFIAAWGSDDNRADFNGDGIVSFADYYIFLDGWDS